MQLIVIDIIKKILKVTIFIVIFFIIIVSLISLYYSPKFLVIKIQNIFNHKFYINKEVTIQLPKNWLYLITEDNIQSSLFYLDKNFIKNNQIDINHILFTLENKNNKGVIEFKDKVDILKVFKLYGEKYTTHNGKNCIYKIYQKNNKIEFIYIPIKRTKLKFKKYNADIPKFIDELCEE